MTALQTMCTRSSRQTDPPVLVTFGRMKVSADPGSLVQGQAA